MRTRLKDETLDLQFEKNGYLLLSNWISPTQIRDLKEIFASCESDLKTAKNRLNSLLLTDPILRKKVSDQIMAVLRPSLEASFEDFMPFFGYFLIKPFGENKEEFHRDPSITQEDQFNYLTIWLPLDDSAEKGSMTLVPQSHRLFQYPLPIDVSWPYSALSDDLQFYAQNVSLKAGDLLLFFAKTIHASLPNLSENSHLVVSSALIHPRSQMLHYYYNPESNIINTHKVDSMLYFRHEIGDPGNNYPFESSFSFEPPAISKADVVHFYNTNVTSSNALLRFFKKLKLVFHK